jgi:hypothetical protein
MFYSPWDNIFDAFLSVFMDCIVIHEFALNLTNYMQHGFAALAA